MAKVLQFRRDTTAGLSTVTGAEGELFVDLTKDTLVVMDGTTAGGQPLQKELTSSVNATVGILTATNVAATQVNVSGASTFASLTATNVAATQVNVSGASTFASLVNAPIFMSSNTITNSVTIPTNFNAMTVGPVVTVQSPAVITVSSNSYWNVVP